MNCRVLSIILLCFLSFSCSKDKLYTYRLDLAESILNTRPDSALLVLEGLKQHKDGISRSERMRYELLCAQARNKTDRPVGNDSIMKQVVAYYDSHGNDNERVLSHYLLGRVYHDKGEMPDALQTYFEALECADTLDNDCDYNVLISVLGQMAEVFNQQYLAEEELEALKLCEHMAIKAHDNFVAAKAYELRMRAYYHLGNADSILSISMNARKRYLDLGYTQEAAQLLNPAISIMIDRGNIIQAAKYIEIFEKNVHEDSLSTIMSPFYYTKGRYYLLCNKVDSAAACFNKIDQDVEKEGAYKGMLMVYQKKQIADSISKYAMLYAAANDSCYINVGQERIAHIASMYRYGRFKSEAEKNASKLVGTERIAIIALASLVCLAIIFYSYMLINKRKRRRNFEKMKELTSELNQTIKLLDTEKQKRAVDIEKYDTLAHVMDEQGCKHDAEMVMLENAIKEKDEKIDLLQIRIDTLNKEVSSLENKEDLQAFLESSIFKTFKYASSHPQYKVSDEEWDSLFAMCRKTFLSYFNFIVSSNNVSSDQMKVAMLMRMGFAETEMAMILDVDNVRINRIKSQINKKLFADNGAKTLRENLKRHF